MSGPDSHDETLTLLADNNSIIVRFPNNVNKYSVKYGKSFKTVCSFIMDNYEKLSWTDFHYVEPPEFLGDVPGLWMNSACIIEGFGRQRPEYNGREAVCTGSLWTAEDIACFRTART